MRKIITISIIEKRFDHSFGYNITLTPSLKLLMEVSNNRSCSKSRLVCSHEKQLQLTTYTLLRTDMAVLDYDGMMIIIRALCILMRLETFRTL